MPPRVSPVSAFPSSLSWCWWTVRRVAAVVAFLLASVSSVSAAAVDWRLLGDWEGSGPHAGFVITFSGDGGYVIQQGGIPAGFGGYAVDGRQILLFPGGSGEFPERGAYGFSGPDQLFVMTQNFGRSEWRRLTAFGAGESDRQFEFGEQSSDDRSSFEKAVEKLEKLSSTLEDVERKLDGGKEGEGEATAEQRGKKRSLFDRMKDAARKTAGSAGNLGRKAARSVKAAGDAWKNDDREEADATETAAADTDSAEEDSAPARESVPAGINPMLGGAIAPAATATGAAGPTSGLAAGLGTMTPPSPVAAFGAASPAVAVDAALARRAALLASHWKADATLVEITAQVGPDGNANVSTPPQAVSLWFASAAAPGEALMMSLAPDGSFVTAPATRSMPVGLIVPSTFIAAGQAVGSARLAGVQGESFHASLRAMSGTGGAGTRFGWVIAAVGGASGGGEFVVDAVTGQPLR